MSLTLLKSGSDGLFKSLGEERHDDTELEEIEDRHQILAFELRHDVNFKGKHIKETWLEDLDRNRFPFPDRLSDD